MDAAVTIWVDELGGDPDKFNEAFLGAFASVTDYAWQLADDLGWTAAMSDAGIEPGYFNAKQFAHDLVIGGDIIVVDHNGETLVLDALV
jgi:antirestriction protein